MNYIRTAVVLLTLAVLTSTSYSQSRDIGARRLLLDNGSGFVLTLQPAPGMSSNGTFTFPDPALTLGTFIMSGPSAGQTISGPLSITSGNASLAVVTSGSNDMVTVTGRDQVGGDLPFVITSDNTGLSYGVTTFGRMLRLDQTGVGFRDLGMDNTGNFFITAIGSTTHQVDLNSSGVLNAQGFITGGTSQGGIINATTGFRHNNTAPSGQYLRGNGTNFVAGGIQASDVPTLNQNTTGTASNVTGVVAIANGGTGQTTQQAAINALTGTQTAGRYLRSDGTNAALSTLNGADLTNGTVPVAAVNATGTPSATTFLRGDGTWNAPAGGGVAVAWGVVSFNQGAGTASLVSSFNCSGVSVGGGPFFTISGITGTGSYTNFNVVVSWYGGVGSDIGNASGILAGWWNGASVSFADYTIGGGGTQVWPKNFVSFVLYAN